jgi:hypothetical protein
MVRILFAWELGGGNGHLGPFHPIARHLLAAGHSITLAVRDPQRALKLFKSCSVEVIQAPLWPKSGLPRRDLPINYSQILLNLGFGEFEICRRVLTEWRAIEDCTEPELIIVDHAPGMLLAARSKRPAVAIGNGFFVPKTGLPMPSLLFNSVLDESLVETNSLLQIELRLLQTVNRVRAELQLQELRSLAEVFDNLNARFLTTFPDIDHYSGRTEAKYWGSLSYDGSRDNVYSWPAGSGPRIFAYLKWSKGLGHLLDAIGRSGCPSIIVTDGMKVSELQQIARPNMQFVDRPLPIDNVAAECDFGILNATHGTTCSLLLAGKPILQVPHNLEQVITALRASATGAAICADKEDGVAMVSAFDSIRNIHQYASAAKVFASRYSAFNVTEVASAIAEDLHQMIV